MTLQTGPRLDDPDLAFESLVEAHRDLTEEQSRLLDARLVLLLANHIGSVAVLREAIAAARAVAWHDKPGHDKPGHDKPGKP